MLQLLYVSAACKPVSQEQLRTLLRTSRANNRRRGVTGMLLYKDEAFMQVLEGPATAVQALYDVIEADERHESVRRLASYQTDARDFPDWKMGFKNLSSLDAEEMPDGFTELAGEDLTSDAFTEDPDFAHRMLLGFKERSFT